MDGMRKMNKEIKPCWNPNCTESITYMEVDRTTFWVECDNCRNRSPMVENYEQAIDLHNNIMILEPCMIEELHRIHSRIN